MPSSDENGKDIHLPSHEPCPLESNGQKKQRMQMLSSHHDTSKQNLDNKNKRVK
jgi:hypothetical protein